MSDKRYTLDDVPEDELHLYEQKDEQEIIEGLKSELEAATSREQEAEAKTKLANLAKGLAEGELEDTKAQLSEANSEIEKLNIALSQISELGTKQAAENAELKEQLTEKDSSLEISKGVLASQFVKRVNDHNRIRDFIAAWQNQDDNEIDTAFDALVELVESPPTGEDDD